MSGIPPALPARRPAHRSRAAVAVLPAAGFSPSPEPEAFSLTPPSGTDRLAWPVAAAAILAACAGLWLGVGALARVLLS